MQTKTINLQMIKGIDTKADSSLQLDGSLTKLENAIFDKVGSFSKRFGFEHITGKGTLTKGAALATYGNELLVFDGNRSYAYSPSTDTYIDRGDPRSIEVSISNIVKNTNQQTSPYSAICLGVGLHVREDSRGGIYYSITDIATGGDILSDRQLNASGVEPKAFALGNNIYVFISNSSGEIKYYTISALAPENGLVSLGNWVTDLDGTKPHFDGITIGSKLFIAYNYNSTSVKVKSIDTNATISSSVTISSMNAAYTISLWSDDSSRLWIGTSDSARIKVAVLSYTLTSVLTATTVETILNVIQMTGHVTGSTATIYYEQDNADTYNHKIKKVTVTTAGTIGTISNFKLSVGLAGKAFLHNSIYYIPVIHQSSFQTTFFIIDETGKIVLRALQGQAGSLPNKRCLPSVNLYNDKYYFPVTMAGAIKSEANTLFTLFGNALVSLDFDGASTFLFANNNNLLYLSGGIVNIYDGSAFAEAGFNLYPENLAYVSASNSGFMAEGDYQYSIVYEWTDHTGKIHPSAPSVAFPATVGTGHNVIQLTIPTLRLTEKEDVEIAVYRNTLNGTVFYKVSSSAAPLFNDPTVDTVTFEDTLADASITSNQLLYTNSGAAYAEPPPPAKAICAWKNRIWVASAENDNVLWFSNKTDPQKIQAPMFSSTRVYQVPDIGGKVVDIAPLGDQLIIFKEYAIYAVSGEGPDELGNNYDYAAPVLLSQTLGAQKAGCVINWSSGLMFKANLGLYNLSPSFQIEYIGAPVEKYNDLNTSGGLALPNTNIVLSTTTEGTTLIYDTFFQEWATWTNMPAIDCITLNQRLYFLTEDGKLYKQKDATHSTPYLDGNASYPLSFATCFYSPMGISSYCQLHKLYLNGVFESDHKLDINIYFNNIDVNPRNIKINATAMNYPGDYGDGYYGEGPYGGYQFRYEYSFKLNKKCKSFKIEVQDFEASGKSYSINALRIDVGLMPGGNRLGGGKVK